MNKKRWLYLGTGTILLMFCGLIYGWSLFRDPFGEVYSDWSISQLSMTFTISMISFCFGGFIAGKMAAKRSSKQIILLSAVLLFSGFLGVSNLNPNNSELSIILLYVFYGIIASAGVGFSYNCVISTVNKWFSDKPGLASGVMMMGFGLGSMILGGIATLLIDITGIFNIFKILGIATFIVIASGAFIIKSPSLKVDELNSQSYGLTPAQMIKMSSFWIYGLCAVLVCAASLMVVNSAAPIASAYGAPAIFGMLVSVSNGLGRITMGWLYDRLDRHKTLVLDILLLITGGSSLLIGALISSVYFIIAGLLFMGIAYGGSPTIAAAFIRNYYDPKHFAVNFSMINFSLIPAALLGPPLSTFLFETGEGSYQGSFIAIVLCGFISLGLVFMLNNACKNESNRL